MHDVACEFACAVRMRSSNDRIRPIDYHLTLKVASTQVVTNNSPSRVSNHPDDLFQSRFITPGLKPFSSSFSSSYYYYIATIVRPL